MTLGLQYVSNKYSKSVRNIYVAYGIYNIYAYNERIQLQEQVIG